MKNLKSTKGFTLVELIVVIAILGILAAVAVPAYTGYITKAHETAVVTELDAIKTAAQAANAVKGDTIGTITVTSSAITVAAKSGKELATDFNADFVMYYGSDKCSVASGASAGAITMSKNIFADSGKTQAVWSGTAWTLS